MEYGPKYLTEEEFAIALEETLTTYYMELAASVFHRQQNGFWKYHIDTLDSTGRSLSYMRFGKAVLTKCLDLIGNPKRTLEKILAAHSAREGSGASHNMTARICDEIRGDKICIERHKPCANVVVSRL